MRPCVVALLMLLWGRVCPASELRVAMVRTPYVQDFNTFTGTWASLPAGWEVSKDGSNVMTSADDDFRGVHPGGVTAGGCYAWMISVSNTSTNMALGYQSTSDEFTPGYFKLAVSNDTGREVRSVSVSYSVVCLNNADRSSSIDMEISEDGVHYRRIDSLRFVSVESAQPGAVWTTTSRQATLLLSSACAPGRMFWLRWVGDDVGGSGARDEYGIDDVTVVCRPHEGTVISIE